MASVLRRRWLGLLALALALSGCGISESDSSEPEKIRFESPAVQADGVISSKYRCGFGSIWIPLRWGPVPDGTRELAVYIGQFSREKVGGSSRFEVPFGLLLTDIEPTVRSIPVNTLPDRTFWGSHKSFNSCPQEREGQSILLQVFALESARPIMPGATLDSDSVTRLTEEAVTGRATATSRWVSELEEETLAVGRFTATYGRR